MLNLLIHCLRSSGNTTSGIGPVENWQGNAKMRYEVIREVPLHDTENDTSQPLDLAHRLVIGTQVDVDVGTDIKDKARVKVTVVEPEPRRTGWMTTDESLKLLTPEPDI